MDDVTVACGCGRKMTMDTLRGRGAFRCGCGARVAVGISLAPSCAAVADGGGRCRFPVVRESAEHGLFLCKTDLRAYKARLEEIRENAVDERSERAYWAYQEELSRERMGQRYDRLADLVATARENGRLVVYYVRIGDWIKIGATTNFERRMSALQPDEVLATEPGYFDLERKRLNQFKHLRIRAKGERHRAGQDLLDHIKMIRNRYGEPTGQFNPSQVSDAL